MNERSKFCPESGKAENIFYRIPTNDGLHLTDNLM
jgi:hypothetical protein